jgi:hypothetical protein
MSRMGDVVLFAGPSLPAAPDAAWRRLLAGVTVAPPAQRGDVLRAVAEGARTLVIVDGYYYTVPAVTHKEILYALDHGVRVIGAASMGALRAAELAAFGMEAVGEVAAAFRRGTLEGDDEVAILHAPGEWGYRAATVALVDVRWALARLVRARTVPAARATRLVAALKALPFTARTPDAVHEHATRALGARGAAALARALDRGSVKRADAKRALAAARAPARRAPRVPPAPHAPAPDTTNFLSHFREWYLHLPAAERDERRRRTIMKAWYMVQLLHADAPRLVAALRRRFLLASEGAHLGLTPARAAAARCVRALRTHLARTPGAPALPALELHAEAREHLLAQGAIRHHGSTRAALVALAARHGVTGPDAEATLVELASLQDDSIPPWILARAHCFSPTCVPAGRVAELGGQVFLAFRRWSGAPRIRERDLRQVAATLWGVPVRATDAEARRRGLLRSHVTHGFVPGHLGAVEILAVAERLPEPVNDYPVARAALRRTRVGHVLGLPGDRALARPARPTSKAR